MKIARVVWQDHAALVTLVFPIVTWAIVGLTLPGWGAQAGDRGRTGTVELALVGAALLVTAVCIPWFLGRLRTIRRLLESGRAIEATVTRVAFWRDRGRIDVEYDLDGRLGRARIAVHRTRRTKAIHAGQRVPLLVDPAKPTRAILPQLFVDLDLPVPGEVTGESHAPNARGDAP